MDWTYYMLQFSRLVDDDGCEANPQWPSFDSEAQAESWLVSQDIRASVR